MALKPADLDREWIVNARALHVDGYDTAAATVAAGWARAAGIPVIADLDELYPGVEVSWRTWTISSSAGISHAGSWKNRIWRWHCDKCNAAMGATYRRNLG